MSDKSLKKLPWIFIGLCSLFFGLHIFVEINNERFWLNDLLVYYSASDAYYHGEQVYGLPFGLSSGFFKYSPFTLLVFYPYRFFSFETVKFIHLAFTLLATLTAFIIIAKQQIKGTFSFRKTNLFLILLFLIGAVHLTRELHLGNVNMLMLFASLLALVLFRREKQILTALILCFIFFMKPYFGIIILPFVAYRQWKLPAYVALSAIVFLMVQVLIGGWNDTILLYQSWLEAMQGHNNHDGGMQTIGSILNTYLNVDIGTKGSFLLIVAIATGYMLVRWFKYPLKDTDTLNVDVYLLLAIIPNLVITDSEHFLYALPLIGFLLKRLMSKAFSWKVVLFILLVFTYGANSTDLLGKELAQTYNQYAFLGLANLALVIWGFVSRYEMKKAS